MQNKNKEITVKQFDHFAIIKKKTKCLSSLKELYLSDMLHNYEVSRKLSEDWDIHTDYHIRIGTSKNENIEGIKKINLLKAEILLSEEINEMVSFTFPEKTKWQLSGPIWYNVYGEGQNAEPHAHVGSDCSFVYFLKYDKNLHTPPVFVDPNGDLCKMDVEEGDLIMFDSNILHYVESNKTDKKRITLAMNAFLISPNEFLTNDTKYE